MSAAAQMDGYRLRKLERTRDHDALKGLPACSSCGGRGKVRERRSLDGRTAAHA